MALLESSPKQKNFSLIDFSLKGTNGEIWSLENIRGENGTLIMFICNHCPYVKAIISRLISDCRILTENNIGCVAVMSNDVLRYPEDSFDNMKVFAKENEIFFPYVIDEDQAVAHSYGAVCTPDFFGFDKESHLQYRGRLDSAGPNEAGSDTKRELLEAMMSVGKGNLGPEIQYPSIGCSIKWKK